MSTLYEPRITIKRPATSGDRGGKEGLRDVPEYKLRIRHLDFYYWETQALFDISMDIPAMKVTALIGPSGCGKSTLIRSLNRMNDVINGTRAEGEVLLDGRDIYKNGTDVVELRKRVGMVFQKSNPFPKSTI